MRTLVNKFIHKYENMTPVARAGVWFVICSMIQKSFSMITTPVFTRLLTQEEFGRYTVYMSWLQILTIICTLRLDYAVFNKGMSKFKEEKEQYTASMQSTTTILTLIVLVIYLIFRKHINELTELSTLVTLLMFAEILFTAAISFWMLRKRYDFRYREILVITIATSAANLVLGLIAVFAMEDRGLARILSCVLIQVCFGLCIYILNYKSSGRLAKWEHIKFAVLFNIPLLPNYFSSYLLEQSDRVMIQKMCGYDEAALYGVAYSLGMIVKIFVNSINNAVVPNQYRQLEEKKYGELKKQLLMLSFFLGGALLMYLTMAPELIALFAAKEYGEAVMVIPPVTLSVYFIFLYSLFSNIEFYYDANKIAVVISGIGAAINIVLNYLFIPVYGYVIAGYTTLFSYILFAVCHYLYVNHVSYKKEQCRVVGSPLLVVISVVILACGLVIGAIYEHTLLRYGVLVLLLAAFLIKRKTIMFMLKK